MARYFPNHLAEQPWGPGDAAVCEAALKDALKASTGCPGLRLASSWVEGPLMVF